MEGDTLHVGFPTDQKMVVESLGTPKNRKLLETLLSNIAGRPVGLKLDLRDDTDDDPHRPGNTTTSPPPIDPDAGDPAPADTPPASPAMRRQRRRPGVHGPDRIVQKRSAHPEGAGDFRGRNPLRRTPGLTFISSIPSLPIPSDHELQ